MRYMFSHKHFTLTIKILHSHANQVITQIMLYITLPALILYSLNTNLSKEMLTDFAWLITMSIFILSISVFIGSLLRSKAALPIKQKSVYESLIIFGNQGFIGFAIIYILMGEKGIVRSEERRVGRGCKCSVRAVE